MTGAGLTDQPGSTGIRAANERMVLTLLRRHGALPKAEIARQTGLSAQAVSVIIRSLEEGGYLLKGERVRGKIGQPSTPMALNPSGAYFLGLKVGRRSVEIALTDFVGRILDRSRKVHAYPDFDDVLDFSAQSAAALQATLPPKQARRIAGIGVAMPFHLWSWAPRIGVAPEKMANWQHRDLQAELAERTGLPVVLQNDATSACSAEFVFGTDPLPANFLHFYMAFFIGAGLVLNGALYTGSRGNAAGFGPLMVPDPSGQARPLLEMASLSHLEQQMQAAGLDTNHIWTDPRHWQAPPEILRPWQAAAAHGLARASHAAMTILDLDAVVIDGWMPSDIRATLVSETAREFDRCDLAGMSRPEFREGTVGPDARLLGAASLPLSARWLS